MSFINIKVCNVKMALQIRSYRVIVIKERQREVKLSKIRSQWI